MATREAVPIGAFGTRLTAAVAGADLASVGMPGMLGR